MPKQVHYITDSLDFNGPPSQQGIIENSQLVELSCMTSLPRKTSDQVPIEFRLEKTSSYIDLRESFLYVRFKVIRQDGTSLKENEPVTTTNLLGYTMWENMELYIEGSPVTENTSLYPYMATIHCETKLPPRYKETALRSALYYRDTAGLRDENNVGSEDAVNEGAVKRFAKIQKSSPCETYTRLLFDFGEIKKLIPSQTELTIRCRPSNPNLCLIAQKNDSTNPLTLEIAEAKLYVTKVNLKPAMATSYEKLLSTKGFRYPLRRYTTRTKTLNVGEQNLEWVPSTGNLPRRMYIYQILQSAYNNNVSKNPFNFQVFGVKNLQVFVNDRVVPLNVPSIMGTEEKARLYFGSISSMDEPAFTVDEFIAGWFIVAIDLTPDQSALSNYPLEAKQGSIRISIDYREPLTEAIVVFCTFEEDAVLHIDQNRCAKWIS